MEEQENVYTNAMNQAKEKLPCMQLIAYAYRVGIAKANFAKAAEFWNAKQDEKVSGERLNVFYLCSFGPLSATPYGQQAFAWEDEYYARQEQRRKLQAAKTGC